MSDDFTIKDWDTIIENGQFEPELFLAACDSQDKEVQDKLYKAYSYYSSKLTREDLLELLKPDSPTEIFEWMLIIVNCYYRLKDQIFQDDENCMQATTNLDDVYTLLINGRKIMIHNPVCLEEEFKTVVHDNALYPLPHIVISAISSDTFRYYEGEENIMIRIKQGVHNNKLINREELQKVIDQAYNNKYVCTIMKSFPKDATVSEMYNIYTFGD